MSDDTKARGKGDRTRIAMNEAYEVAYWTKKLGISREELEAAVDAVGNRADKVEEHIQSVKGR